MHIYLHIALYLHAAIMIPAFVYILSVQPNAACARAQTSTPVFLVAASHSYVAGMCLYVVHQSLASAELINKYLLASLHI